MDKKIIRQRLRMLRTAMREEGIDFYLVPTADFHNSEYVCDFFKVREFLSGFTGSNGTLVISENEAGLWTDGRYFIQAQKELEDTGILLFKMKEEGVPDIKEYLKEHMEEGQCLGFDGRVVDADFGSRLERELSENKVHIAYTKDIADLIWHDRPSFPCSQGEVVPRPYRGNEVTKKLEQVRKEMKKKGASCFFLSKLDDIMWLMNLRGSDIDCNPVLLSYLFVTETEAYLFLQAGALNQEVVDSMEEFCVQIRDYHKVLHFLEEYFWDGTGKRLQKGRIMYDGKNTSYTFCRLFRRYGNLTEYSNPTQKLKAAKTETELSHIRKIYLKDSIAVTKFIYWVKHYPQKEELTEYSAGEYMDNLRKAIPEWLDFSFPTISAYGPNAAMMHYRAGKEDCSGLKAEGMLLVDSGGQYLGGTTDVTRTIALGELTPEMKHHYTLAALGMLKLANARFLHGCTGRNLDILARGSLWQEGIDYKCGTGHGIGYMLNVHEGPQSIRPYYADDVQEAVLEEGMLLSDEPGVYLAGKYGIRIENILEVKKGVKNQDGQFMEFSTLTYVPLERDAIDISCLSERERADINNYQREVFEKISPYLTKEEAQWLKEVTDEI